MPYVRHGTVQIVFERPNVRKPSRLDRPFVSSSNVIQAP